MLNELIDQICIVHPDWTDGGGGNDARIQNATSALSAATTAGAGAAGARSIPRGMELGIGRRDSSTSASNEIDRGQRDSRARPSRTVAANATPKLLISSVSSNRPRCQETIRPRSRDAQRSAISNITNVKLTHGDQPQRTTTELRASQNWRDRPRNEKQQTTITNTRLASR
jgi:hypothetical protein